jgi:sugar phosphate isomerase/epimerase
MPPKIALQLYTLRDLTKDDFEGVVRKVAAMGYDGVETAGFGNSNLTAAQKLFKELGLEVAGTHVPMPLGDKKNEIIEISKAFDCKYLTVAAIGPNDVKDMVAIKDLCDRLNQSQAVANENGLTLAIHNHWWEYARLNGKLIADIMIELMDPAILFELDTYWILVGGSDPAERVHKLGTRAPLLHIKDGPGVREQPQTAIGDGIMDFDAILKAGGVNTEWWIMEADQVAGDALEAVEKSFQAMKGLLK